MQNSIAQALLVLALLIAASSAGPATQPTGNSAVFQTDADRVPVLPFYEAAPTNQVWVGKAIQQDLLADLTRSTRARIEAPSTTPAVQDAAAALEAGKKAGAALVVYGQFQNAGGQMRVTGQVLSVNSAQAVGSITSTAPANDLFPLEDAVSMQVLRALPADWLTTPLPPIPGAFTAPATAPVSDALAQTSPAQQSQPTAKYYSYTYPNYPSGPPSLYPNEYLGSPYSYGYPYYWYSIPYYGPDVFFYYGRDHYHHHHHHDFGHADRWHESGLHELGRADGRFGIIGTSHAPEGRSVGGSAAHGGGGGGGFHGSGGAHR